MPKRKQNPLLRPLKFKDDKEFSAGINPPESIVEPGLSVGTEKSGKLVLKKDGRLNRNIGPISAFKRRVHVLIIREQG